MMAFDYYDYYYYYYYYFIGRLFCCVFMVHLHYA